jgi:hypothetical protein
MGKRQIQYLALAAHDHRCLREHTNSDRQDERQRQPHAEQAICHHTPPSEVLWWFPVGYVPFGNDGPAKSADGPKKERQPKDCRDIEAKDWERLKTVRPYNKTDGAGSLPEMLLENGRHPPAAGAKTAGGG